MSTVIATKRADLLAPYLALDQGSSIIAECEFSHSSQSKSSAWLPNDPDGLKLSFC